MPPLDPGGVAGARSRSGVSSGGGFAFGPYHLDPSVMRLMQDGVLVKLPPRQVTVLHALVAASGQVVLKDHLIQIGWKQIVSDSSLEKLISELRKALDPDDPHRYIRTVSGHGYQFVASITRTVPVVDIAALLAPDRMWGAAMTALESMKRDDLVAGRGLLEQLVETHPDEPRYRILLALTCALLYDSTRTDLHPDTATLDRAVAEAHEAVRLAPDRIETSATLGFCLDRKGDHAEALAAARRAVRLDGSNWLNHGRLATSSWGEERLRAVRDTLRLNPGFGIACFLGANVWVARESYDEVDRMVEAGVKAMEAEVAAPARFSVVGLYYLKGLLCIRAGRIPDALAALDREIELESRGHIYGRECCANAWYAKGACYLILDDLAAARASFLEALERVAHHPLALAGIEIIGRLGGSGLEGLGDEDRRLGGLGLEGLEEGSRLEGLGLEGSRDGQSGVVGADLVSALDVPSARHESLRFEREMAKAALLVHAGDVPAAVRLLDAALAEAPPGSTGWIIPIDPLLRVWDNRETWRPVLERLALRAR
jgi:DNA-binding winged helix-turn-helix (wHTH) protein